jgi:hypothetical protein
VFVREKLVTHPLTLNQISRPCPFNLANRDKRISTAVVGDQLHLRLGKSESIRNRAILDTTADATRLSETSKKRSVRTSRAASR